MSEPVLDIRRPSPHVAEVWLNRPEVRNAFNDGVIAALTETFTRLNQDTDLRVVVLPANAIAAEIGNERATNMVMLGALMANMDILPEGALDRALKAHTAQRLQKFVEMNTRALARGGEYKAS